MYYSTQGKPIMSFLTAPPKSGKPQWFSGGWSFSFQFSFIFIFLAQPKRGQSTHCSVHSKMAPQPSALTNKQSCRDGLSRHLPGMFFSQTGLSQGQQTPANMNPVFHWILLNNLSKENVQSLAMGAAWGRDLYKSPDVVNSCRIQLSWSLQFCFQLELDQNQAVCQQNVNHCLATYVGTQIATLFPCLPPKCCTGLFNLCRAK